MTGPSFETPNFEAMRRAMVTNQLRTGAVNDPRVVAAMGAVARERFVPEPRRALAYVDTAVPLGGGRFLNPPMVTGRLIAEAGAAAGERALVVGAASGYAAAVLAAMGLTVTALEEDEALAGAARAALADVTATTVVEGPLAAGWAASAPYDLILVDGAIETVPDALVAQLGGGGRLAAALADRGVTRVAIGRRGGGGFGLVTVADIAAAPLPGFARPRTFSF